ncbi:MAG: hypothetical protein HFF59_03915 [Lawsonibacter sp.]|jgi:hypothetical protein|uniref:hypothetical protein n=1 Tax=Lawsonibacter sp. JLR.KK007 TaxID=3114293 RepID=UPI00216CA92F|nr:hypothetical protein [Lawsonibacter sp.]MCI8989945.1 hypothetical protein [Lawsonibacter sp.]MCI9268087.1 hypothetical protein [Lawsonibacter sp.]
MAKQKQGIRAALAAAHDALRRKRTVAVVYFTLRLLVIAVMVAQFFNGDFESVFLCGLTLVLFLLPTVFERALMIDLPNTMEIIIMLFIFAAEILGEISSFYTTFKGWDTILHTLNGFLCAAIGFALVDMLNRTEKFSLSLSPVFMSIVAFCFSMTIGVLWEFFECGMDQLFLLDMQKDTVVHSISSVMLDPAGGNSRVAIDGITDTILVTAGGQQISLGLGGYLDIGLLDTMKDLFVNFVGAVVFSVIGFFYVKSRGQGRFASRFIPQVVDVQPEDIDPRQPHFLKKAKRTSPPRE